MAFSLPPTRRHLLAAAAVVALGAIHGPTAADAADPVKIGYALSQTGQFAPAAASQAKAYELWAAELEARGGLNVAGEMRPVEFVVYDDQSDFGKTPAIYEKLITDDQVDLLLAPWGTPFHFALTGVVERYQFPVVGNTAASVQLRDVQPGNIWFPTTAVPDLIANDLVALLKAEGHSTVAVNMLQLPYSQEINQFLLPALEDAGIEIVVAAEYSPGTKDMTATLTQIRDAAPDAIISLSYPPDSVVYMNQAREIGVDAPFQLVLIGPTAAFFSGIFGDNLEGITTVGHWSPEQDAWPRARPFYDAYVAMHGEAPDYLDSALAYVSLEILEQAVAEVGLDKDALREHISSATFDTINGPVRFDGVQNAETPSMLLQYQSGAMEIVWPADQATSELIAKPDWN